MSAKGAKLQLKHALLLFLFALCSQLAFAETEDFYSPDRSCHLIFKSSGKTGQGQYFDANQKVTQIILKENFRIGPMVNWISNSVAELFFSEGSPAYHSYYYDCATHRVSPSYFQSIAVDLKHSVVATLGNDEIIFFRLFTDSVIHLAKTPEVPMLEFLSDCESGASFDDTGAFHVSLKSCSEWHDVNLEIKLPSAQR